MSSLPSLRFHGAIIKIASLHISVVPFSLRAPLPSARRRRNPPSCLIHLGPPVSSNSASPRVDGQSKNGQRIGKHEYRTVVRGTGEEQEPKNWPVEFDLTPDWYKMQSYECQSVSQSVTFSYFLEQALLRHDTPALSRRRQPC
mmetsp:Transcript_31313/g.46466  ORF Transcript_31313/g.46466 Transcript_31313/m.46466 type:complete len:143 (-) Transcript_31313:270-698(-)